MLLPCAIDIEEMGFPIPYTIKEPLYNLVGPSSDWASLETPRITSHILGLEQVDVIKVSIVSST